MFVNFPKCTNKPTESVYSFQRFAFSIFSDFFTLAYLFEYSKYSVSLQRRNIGVTMQVQCL